MSVNRRVKVTKAFILEGSSGKVNILPHPSSSASFNWYLPPNAGAPNELLGNNSTSGLPEWTSTPTLSAIKVKDSVSGNVLTIHAPTLGGDIDFTLPATQGNLVSAESTDTFKNKTITDSSNIVTANRLRTTGADVSVVAAAPTAGQILQATSTTAAAWISPTFLDNIFSVLSSSDQSKILKFAVGGTTGHTLTVQSQVTADRTLTLPDRSDTLVTLSGTETLSGKTLTLPTVASIDNGGTVTIPTGAGTFATIAATQTLTNKTLTLPTIASIDNGGTVTIPSGSGTFATIAATQTLTNKTLVSPIIDNGGTVTIPTGAGTFATIAATQTLTNKTLTLPTIASIDNGGTITIPTGAGTFATIAATQTLTNKTLTLPTIASINNGGTVAIPSGAGTFATIAATQTLTNKTLVSPVIDNGGTITIPSGTDTFATLTATQTLTNKILTLPTIASINNGGTVAIPSGADTFATLTATQTLTNKTLTLPTIASIDNGGTVTIPSGVGTFATIAATQTLTNKTLTLPTIASIDNGGTIVIPSGAGTFATLTAIQTLSNKTLVSPVIDNGGTVTIPSGAGTFVTIAATQTLTNKTLTLPTIASIDNGGTITIPTGVDTFATLTATQTLTNKTLTLPTVASINNGGTITIPSGVGTFVTVAATQTLTNKTLTLPTISSIDNSGTVVIPTGAGTFATIAATQTLTNKTLTLPTIASIDNGGTITIPSGADTFVTATATQTLTNKTLTLPTVASINNGGTVVIPTGAGTFATVAATQTLTNKTLTLPTIASIDNGGTIGIPTGAGTFATIAATQTLTNKTLTNPVISTIVNGGATLTLPTATDTIVGLSTTPLTGYVATRGDIAATDTLLTMAGKAGYDIKNNRWVGTWSSSTQFQTDNLTTRNGNIYLALVASLNADPNPGTTGFSLFSLAFTPTSTSSPTSAEIGTRFQVGTAGTITEIKFYKYATDTATTHTVKIWSPAGVVLASAVTSGEAASGWIVTTLNTPLSISASTVYTVSYNKTVNSPTAFDTFSGANQTVITVVGGGVNYTPGQFPSGNTVNYYVDITFVPAATGSWDLVCKGLTTLQEARLNGATSLATADTLALRDSTGYLNIASNAQFSSYFGTGSGNTRTSLYNTAAGYQSLATYNNPSVSTRLSAFGSSALSALTTGVDNSAFGQASGVTLTTGSRCTLVGSTSDAAASGANDAIAIGYGASAPASTAVIGNTSVTEMRNMGNGTCSLGNVSNKWGAAHITAALLYGPNTTFKTTLGVGTQTADMTITLPVAASVTGAFLQATDTAGTLRWVDQTGFVEFANSTAQAISGTTAVAINVGTATGAISGLTNTTTTFTAARNMSLIINCSVQFTSAAASNVSYRVYIRRSGRANSFYGRNQGYSGNSGLVVAINASTVIALTAAETFQILFVKDNATSVSLSNGTANTTTTTIKEII